MQLSMDHSAAEFVIGRRESDGPHTAQYHSDNLMHRYNSDSSILSLKLVFIQSAWIFFLSKIAHFEKSDKK